MDLTTTAPLDPVVMAQQIQALIANVQELMKQNEDLKRKVRPKGTSTSQSRRNCNKNDDKAERNFWAYCTVNSWQRSDDEKHEEGVRRSQEHQEGKDSDKSWWHDQEDWLTLHC